MPEGACVTQCAVMASFAKACLCGLLLLPASALAQDKPAEDPKAYGKAISALEAVYEAHPYPDLLLNIASLYELWEGHCSEALESYRRFFTACTSCPSLAYATERFDVTIERCIEDPEEEIAVREKFIVPAGQKPARKRADATRREVVNLLHEAEKVDRNAAGMLFVALAETNPQQIGSLNELRGRAWAVIKKTDATSEQVFKLLQRIKRVDHTKYQTMLSKLVKAEFSKDKGALNQLRQEAMDTILARSSGVPDKKRLAKSGCHANLEREWGFLTVSTSPWSTVYVNGRKQGGTPVSKVEVLAGCATVRAVDPVSGRQIVKNVTIRPNLNAILRIDLETGKDSLRYN